MNARPAYVRYLPSVDAFVPGCHPEERRYRAGLMLIRDIATAEAQKAAPEAAAIMDTVASIAAIHATAVPDGRLKVLRAALIRAMMAARSLNEVFGGADG